MNSVNIIGRLCKEPELRRTNEGTAVCSYSLAVKRPMAKDMTDFPECVSWKQGAEYLAQYGHKGDWVAVSGSLQSREWTDKEGKKHKSWEVVTTFVELLSSKKDAQGNNQPAQNQNGFQGQVYNPQQGFSQPQQGFQQPQFNQQGFGGYQQGGYPAQNYQPPQGNFPVIDGDDPHLPF